MRLFVAIRPPRPARELLLAAMGGISGARWQDDDQLHATLRFIGEVDRRQAEDADAALRSVRHPGFEVRLSGAGTFERRGAPSAVWAGLSPEQPLHRLHKKIDQALVRAGLEPEGRAFQPHVTLARLGRNAGPIGGFLDRAGNLSSPPFRIDAFVLFESALTPDGAVYSIVERYPLS